MKILLSLRSEILKTRRTASFYFTLIGAAAMPVIFLLNVLFDDDLTDATRKDPLNGIFKLAAEMNGLVFFPLFVILVCTLLPQVEYRNNTWKQVFSSPQTKAAVFLAKFINIHLLIVLFLVAHFFFLGCMIVAAHFIKPELHLLSQPFDAGRVLLAAGNAYVTILALCAFQFWLGLRFRNFIVPTAVGLALWLTGMILAFEFKSGIVDYLPHSFQLYALVPQLKAKLPQIAWTSVAYTVVFLGLGFLDFRRRRLTA